MTAARARRSGDTRLGDLVHATAGTTKPVTIGEELLEERRRRPLPASRYFRLLQRIDNPGGSQLTRIPGA